MTLTEKQAAAFAALGLNRGLTQEELNLLAIRNDRDLAIRLNASVPRTQTTLVWYSNLLPILGHAVSNALLDAIAADAQFKYAVKAESIDLNDADLQATFEAWAANGVIAGFGLEQVNALKALTIGPPVITQDLVSTILNEEEQ